MEPILIDAYVPWKVLTGNGILNGLVLAVVTLETVMIWLLLVLILMLLLQVPQMLQIEDFKVVMMTVLILVKILMSKLDLILLVLKIHLMMLLGKKKKMMLLGKCQLVNKFQ